MPIEEKHLTDNLFKNVDLLLQSHHQIFPATPKYSQECLNLIMHVFLTSVYYDYPFQGQYAYEYFALEPSSTKRSVIMTALHQRTWLD